VVSIYSEHMSTSRLQVLIPQALDARVQKAATRRRMSKGQWVREAIEKALADRGVDDPVARLAQIDAPTGDIDQMLAEIEAGRG
jgi:hypothetical protein